MVALERTSMCPLATRYDLIRANAPEMIVAIATLDTTGWKITPQMIMPRPTTM